MRILILGGGKVGAAVAEFLCTHRHEVTVIEKDSDKAKQLDDNIDANVIHGCASHADVLFQADATAAEICLAVTENDETNLIGASLAKAMGVRRVAARVYSPSIRDTSTIDYKMLYNIDRLLSIEMLTASEFAREIRTTGDLMIEHFAGGEVEMQEILIFNEPPEESRKPLCELKFPQDVRVGIIRRQNEVRIASASDIIQQGDRITLIGISDKIEQTKQRFQGVSPKPKKILIGGGGETGFQLASILRNRRHYVTILEKNEERCGYLSEHLRGCTVLHGDATNRNLLQTERAQNYDAFIACTGQDEENIIAALEVKEYRDTIRTMVLVNRPDYHLLTDKLRIDKTIIPANVIAKQVMGFLNTGSIVFRNRELFGGAVDVVELEVQENAPITKDILRNVKIPKGSLLAAVNRSGFVQVPNADFQFRKGDYVVALVQPEMSTEIVKLF
ncbi:Trk system potassium transport protein TrkA [Planctomycetales bacterium]|nr:Trk system potassium transport protein TrkA [Planctomycetales bacterium]